MIPHSRGILGPREASAAAKAVRAGVTGKEVAAFEREAAAFLGVRGAVAVSSGTTALGVALKAVGAGPGSEVIVPAYASAALLHAVWMTGAAPVLADVHWHDMNLSAAQARRRLTHRTAAVVAVHGFGASVELEPLLGLGVPVVEDVAQAFGAVDYNRKKLGAFGQAGTVSFQTGKLMTAAGEGGMVFSDDRRILDAAMDLREYEGKNASRPRWSARMTDVQAAVGRVQLRRLPSFLAERRRWADAYRQALEGFPLDLPLEIFGRVYHRFVIKARRSVSDEMLSAFARAGVGVQRPVFRPLSWDLPGPETFPVTERVWRRALSLPLYPALSPSEFRKVVSLLRTQLAKGS